MSAREKGGRKSLMHWNEIVYAGCIGVIGTILLFSIVVCFYHNSFVVAKRFKRRRRRGRRCRHHRRDNGVQS